MLLEGHIAKKLKAVPNMNCLFKCSACLSPTTDVVLVDKATFGNLSEKNPQGFPVFSYNELEVATNGFSASRKIGQGAFGSVYKGELKDGSMVAVKVLSVELDSLRGEREFIAEVAALSDIKHENLVPLRGCCIEGAKRLLVYEYMENNSLALTLLGPESNRKKFGWEARRDISLGIARGIAYLHEEVQPYVVHRDIKSSNILLDQNFIPKVADFGLSKLFRNNISHISTHVAGTLGYLAPEYAFSGHLTRKSDIYGFGVLLLEIFSGEPIVSFDLEHGEHYLVQKAWEMLKSDRLVQLVDPTLNHAFNDEEATRYLKVGLLCVQQTASMRPQMSTAVKMMTNEISLEDVKITKPGHVANILDIKVGKKPDSHTFSSSKASTSSTSYSNHSTYF
uniref:non-specific serine/threonine protein kinase n=1 Tax=Kalanchoe fedtschenkoi TaxID=63787 RepID=A0A7N0UV58_KALFE